MRPPELYGVVRGGGNECGVVAHERDVVDPVRMRLDVLAVVCSGSGGVGTWGCESGGGRSTRGWGVPGIDYTVAARSVSCWSAMIV